jgi:hypothetical protein
VRSLYVWLAITLAYLVGFMNGGIIAVQDIFKKSFLEVKATDAIAILVNICVAIFVTIYASKYFSLDVKKRDLVVALLVRFESGLQKMYSETQSYIARPTTVREDKILNCIQASSQQFEIVKAAAARSKLVSNSALSKLEHLFICFHEAITSQEFRSSSPNYGSAQQKEIQDAYERVMTDINTTKSDIYV